MKNQINYILSAFILVTVLFASCTEDSVSPSDLNETKDAIFNPNATYGTMTDQDGNSYKTITIGSLTWMVENLRTTHFRDGSKINSIQDSASWRALTTAAYCTYTNATSAMNTTYGLIYNGYCIQDIRNIAPTGWHIPTITEWYELIDNVGGKAVAGGKLKESGTSHWTSPNLDATNSSGFTAIPGTGRSSDGGFGDNINWANLIWTSTIYPYSGNTPMLYTTWLDNESASASIESMVLGSGLTIRCVKDYTPSIISGSVTDIDGNVYKTIRVGSQVWMAENLKVNHYQNGDAIPNITSGSVWSTLTSGGYCDYNNTPSNSDVYGKIYNWGVVTDSRLVAPAGWHIPTDAEWTTLTDFLGGLTVAGGKMKEKGTTHFRSPNNGATNEYNFTGLPNGYRNSTAGAYIGIKDNAAWWSSTEISSVPKCRYLGSDYFYVIRGDANKMDGFGIRCIKNN